MKKTVRLYNVLFPIWMLVFFPSPLWIALIPANYLIDRFVLKRTLPKTINRAAFCKKNAWKICVAGFVSDLIGALILFLIVLLLEDNYELANGITMDPFKDLLSFLIVLMAVVVSAVFIFIIDRLILIRCGLSRKQATRSAAFLAVFTAPYLYLFPSKFLYR